MKIEIEQLETNRLIIRKLKQSDLEDYLELKMDESIHAFQQSDVKANKEEYKIDFDEILNGYNNTESLKIYWLAIELKEENKVVGCLSIVRMSEQNKFCSMGWEINAKYRRKGIAFEGASKLIEYLFKEMNLHRIQINIWEGNQNSLNLAKKLGFQFEGTSKEARIKNGKYLDVWNLALLNK